MSLRERLSKLRAKVRRDSAYLTAGQKDNDLSRVCARRMCVCVYFFSPRDLEDCITVTILRHMTVSTKKTLMTPAHTQTHSQVITPSFIYRKTYM